MEKYDSSGHILMRTRQNARISFVLKYAFLHEQRAVNLPNIGQKLGVCFMNR